MRRVVTVVLSATALALPTTSAWAAAASRATTTAKKKVTTATKSFTGALGSADRYGDVEVKLVVRKTTTTLGTRRTVKRHLVSISIPVYPDHTGRSVYISQQALPWLIQEALKAQSAERRHDLGRDVHEPGLHRLAPGCDCPVEAVVSPVATAAARLPGVRRIEHIMGMPIIVDVRDDGLSLAELDPVFAWFSEVDRTFSTFKPDSQISLLNRDELAIHAAHADVREVLQRCEALRVETNGAFDVRAGSQHIDPSGYVKGWSVDRAGAILRWLGAANFSINAGGDVLSAGAALPEPRWRVGIQHPLRRDRLAKVVEGSDLAVATSGAYERGGHVLDARTGLAPRRRALGDGDRALSSERPTPSRRPPTRSARPLLRGRERCRSEATRR